MRDTAPYRSNRRRRWLSTVRGEIPRRVPISSLVAPTWTSRRIAISRSLGGRGPSRAAASASPGNAVPPLATVLTARRISATSVLFARKPAAPRSNAARMKDDRSNEVRTITLGPPRPTPSISARPSVAAPLAPPPSWRSHRTTSGASSPDRARSARAATASRARPTIAIGGPSVAPSSPPTAAPIAAAMTGWSSTIPSRIGFTLGATGEATGPSWHPVRCGRCPSAARRRSWHRRAAPPTRASP